MRARVDYEIQGAALAKLLVISLYPHPCLYSILYSCQTDPSKTCSSLSLIQQFIHCTHIIFLKYLVCARHCTRHYRDTNE